MFRWWLAPLIFACWGVTSNAFLSLFSQQKQPRHVSSSYSSRYVRQNMLLPRLFSSLQPIDTMRISEIRQELESYGISTSTFLEKREMINALQKARDEGKQPTSTTTTTSVGVNSPQERRKLEMENAQRRKVSELKSELERRGISTKSFIEKSDFVKAYVDVRMMEEDKDNQNSDGGRRYNNSQQRQQTQAKTNQSNKMEDDPSYRNVIMYKMEKSDPRLTQGRIIDVRLAK
jgi:hypothetical protein